MYHIQQIQHLELWYDVLQQRTWWGVLFRVSTELPTKL